jgi:hypothetical protein
MDEFACIFKKKLYCRNRRKTLISYDECGHANKLRVVGQKTLWEKHSDGKQWKQGTSNKEKYGIGISCDVVFKVNFCFVGTPGLMMENWSI